MLACWRHPIRTFSAASVVVHSRSSWVRAWSLVRRSSLPCEQHWKASVANCWTTWLVPIHYWNRIWPISLILMPYLRLAAVSDQWALGHLFSPSANTQPSRWSSSFILSNFDIPKYWPNFIGSNLNSWIAVLKWPSPRSRTTLDEPKEFYSFQSNHHQDITTSVCSPLLCLLWPRRKNSKLYLLGKILYTYSPCV